MKKPRHPRMTDDCRHLQLTGAPSSTCCGRTISGIYRHLLGRDVFEIVLDREPDRIAKYVRADWVVIETEPNTTPWRTP